MSAMTAEKPATATEVEFVAPIPGLADHLRFELHRLDEEGVLFSLRAAADPGLRLIVVAPDSFFPDYAPEIYEETAEALELTTAEDASVFLVVNPGKGLADATVNLMAPVVLNVRSARAAQPILTGSGLPVRAPLLGE